MIWKRDRSTGKDVWSICTACESIEIVVKRPGGFSGFWDVYVNDNYIYFGPTIKDAKAVAEKIAKMLSFGCSIERPSRNQFLITLPSGQILDNHNPMVSIDEALDILQGEDNTEDADELGSCEDYNFDETPHIMIDEQDKTTWMGKNDPTTITLQREIEELRQAEMNASSQREDKRRQLIQHYEDFKLPAQATIPELAGVSPERLAEIKKLLLEIK